jgi:ABC-2 type transport system ATP-binding protein
VDEGTDLLAAKLAAVGLRGASEGRALIVPLESEDTYDQIMRVVADLDLPLHRLDQRRHNVAELFATPQMTEASRAS